MSTYVKTVYDSVPHHHCPPNVSEYAEKEDAERFVKMCLKWGIAIVSCEIIDEATALALIEKGDVEYDKEE